MLSIRIHIFSTILLLGLLKNISGVYEAKTENNIESNDLHNDNSSTNKFVLLPYWDPNPESSVERRRSNKRDKWLKPVWRANYSDDHKEEPILKEESENVSISANMSGKRSRFGLHDGLRVRFSRNGRHGKEPDISSTRIAPMHLVQQDAEQPKEKEKEHHKASHKKKHDIFDGDPFILSPYAIESQFTKLLSEFDDVEFTTEVLGRTVSYTDIVLFKISQKGSNFFRANDHFVENEAKEKKILFIVHALSPMGLANLYTLTLENYLKRLVGYYLEHLDKFDIYFIPMANPDGYLKVKNDPMWNKNFAINADCPGVNVDRNFDVAWNSTEFISSCSQHYPGVKPFSEPESRAVRDVFHRKSHKIAAYFHVHGGTYSMNTFKGDAVLYPRGYTDHQSDDDKYVDLKAEIDDAMKNANFKVISVTVDTLYLWYGKVSGTSVDYAATVYGIPYAMELVMQLYEDAFQTYYRKMLQPSNNNATLEDHALEQIWKRVINVIFTNIHKKIEGEDNI